MLNIKLNQKVNRIIFALVIAGAAFSSVAETDTVKEVTPVIERRVGDGRIEIFGDAFQPNLTSLRADQAQIIFYRADSASSNNAASIFVNGSYHTSLIGGGHSLMCTKAASIQVGVAPVQAGERPREARGNPAPAVLSLGKTVYLKVREGAAGVWSLEPVAENEARIELARTREQIHTLSRVAEAEECRQSEVTAPQSAPVPAPVAVPQAASGQRS